MHSNKEFLAEFVRGAGFSVIVMCFFLAFVYGLGKIEEGRGDGAKSESRFKVIDQYGPCEIVRFMPKGEAKYVYFLDCK
jgi:hypothetical protein